MACALVRAAFHRSIQQAHAIALRSAVAPSSCRNAGSQASTVRAAHACLSSVPRRSEQLPVIAELEVLVRSVCARLYPGHVGALPESSPIVSISRHADYQTNAAMLLAKALKKPAVDVAKEIAAGLRESKTSVSLVSDVSMSAGFVNLSLNNAYLGRRLETVVETPYACHQNSPTQIPAAPRALVDFSSPNMGKELHVGHLRSSVIGDTIARILQYSGYNVDRVSHIGDAGVPLALLMTAYLEQEAGSQSQWRQLSAKQLLTAMEHPSTSIALPNPAEFSELYAKAKKRMDRITETEYAARVQSTLRTLQTVLASRTSAGAPVSLPEDQLYIYALWKMICHVSRANIQPILDLLNVTVQERGESTYLPDVENVVAGLLVSNAATVTQGAVGIFVDGAEKPPFLLRKADGGYVTLRLYLFRCGC
jgi:arginyl-tRNA synthetase